MLPQFSLKTMLWLALVGIALAAIAVLALSGPQAETEHVVMLDEPSPLASAGYSHCQHVRGRLPHRRRAIAQIYLDTNGHDATADYHSLPRVG